MTPKWQCTNIVPYCQCPLFMLCGRLGSNRKPWKFAWKNIILLTLITAASLGTVSVVAYSPANRSLYFLSDIQDRWSRIACSVPLWNMTDITLMQLGATLRSKGSQTFSGEKTKFNYGNFSNFHNVLSGLELLSGAEQLTCIFFPWKTKITKYLWFARNTFASLAKRCQLVFFSFFFFIFQKMITCSRYTRYCTHFSRKLWAFIFCQPEGITALFKIASLLCPSKWCLLETSGWLLLVSANFNIGSQKGKEATHLGKFQKIIGLLWEGGVHASIFSPSFCFLLGFINARLGAREKEINERVREEYFFLSPVKAHAHQFPNPQTNREKWEEASAISPSSTTGIRKPLHGI